MLVLYSACLLLTEEVLLQLEDIVLSVHLIVSCAFHGGALATVRYILLCLFVYCTYMVLLREFTDPTTVQVV
jgi:hypothetical protein